MEYNVQEICKNFSIAGEIVSCERFGKGHINDTFKLVIENNDKKESYVLQRINNNLFTNVDALMNNIELVTEFCKKKIIANNGDPLRQSLTVVKTKDNKSYYYDGQNYFRIYLFIENATAFQIVKDSKDFYQSAVAFGNFANLLADFDASNLYEVIPNFHNTKLRYKNFIKAVEEDKFKRAKEVEKEIEWVKNLSGICGTIVDKIENKEIPLRVTHNDTKLNNVMIDDKTGLGLAVIDLDTVMPGSLCYDFGDSIRFGCNPCSEDEKDLSKVNFRIDLYEVYLKGYLSKVGESITKIEREHLPMGAILMTYECGMRFLTDYLEGDVYFRTNTETQNLDRARVQFKLVDDMYKVYDQMLKLAMEI